VLHAGQIGRRHGDPWAAPEGAALLLPSIFRES
jgi:hypothetical protein